MAPPTTYEKPQVQLGRLMVAARRRGLSFEAWWEEAIRPGQSVVMTNTPNPPAHAVRWPSDRNDRLEWMAAIVGGMVEVGKGPAGESIREWYDGSKEGWRRAYEQVAPTRAEEALAFLADAIGALAELASVPAEVEPEKPDDDLRELMAA